MVNGTEIPHLTGIMADSSPFQLVQAWLINQVSSLRLNKWTSSLTNTSGREVSLYSFKVFNPISHFLTILTSFHKTLFLSNSYICSHELFLFLLIFVTGFNDFLLHIKLISMRSFLIKSAYHTGRYIQYAPPDWDCQTCQHSLFPKVSPVFQGNLPASSHIVVSPRKPL